MKVKIKTVKDDTEKFVKNIAVLSEKTVEVGVFNGEHAWLAHIHEFGCDISARKAKYLTVPITPKAKGKKASDIPDLKFVQAKSGEKFLAKISKNKMELYFWLTKSVRIPERSFLRSGHDEHAGEIIKKANMLLKKLLNNKINVQQFLDGIGEIYATKIKKFARDLNEPKNSPVTSEVKRSSNPLVDTGNMIESITWRVK